MRHIIIAALILLGSTQGSTQNVSTEPHLSVMLYGGLSIPNNAVWYFYGDHGGTTVQPNAALSIGVQYGPIVQVKGALVSTSLEVGYVQYGIIDHSLGTGKADMVKQRLPLMLWGTLETKNDLSPYLKLGLGISKTDFREIYTDTYGPSIRFHRWNFCWGIGAGLRFQYSEIFDIALFVDDWITEDKILEQNRWGDEAGIPCREGFVLAGLRVTWHL